MARTANNSRGRCEKSITRSSRRISKRKTVDTPEHSFNVFPEILLERREFASDPIEACTVTLAEPIVASLLDEHFTCLNHPMMMMLGTIGQALMMRLFFHFANHYDGRNRRQLKF